MVNMMVPPAAVPAVVERLVIVGAARYLNPFDNVAVWPSTVTMTLMEPAAWEGVVAVQVVVLLHVTLVAAFPPKVKLVLPLVPKLVPVMVAMMVPPLIDPVTLDRLVRVGADR